MRVAEKSMWLIKGVVVMKRAVPADKGRMVMKLFPTSLDWRMCIMIGFCSAGRHAREIFYL
jgi:hypothetical protein